MVAVLGTPLPFDTATNIFLGKKASRVPILAHAEHDKIEPWTTGGICFAGMSEEFFLIKGGSTFARTSRPRVEKEAADCSRRGLYFAKCNGFEVQARSCKDFGDHVGISEVAVLRSFAFVTHPEVYGPGCHKGSKAFSLRELFIHRPRRRTAGQTEVKALRFSVDRDNRSHRSEQPCSVSIV